ncbi:MAG: YfiR family protein [Alphaproteobacteria bacterium]
MAVLIAPGRTPPGRRARARWTIFAVLAAALAAGAASAAEDKSLEYSVKAAYLAKFGNFIHWPDSVFTSPASAINLCVAGEDPFGETLDKAVSGQHVGERPIAVRRLKTVERNSGCQILYIAGSSAQSVVQALDAVRGASVLTVTDAASDGNAAGIVRLALKDNHVRFDIDDQAASQCGLTISSELLKLALTVKPRK